MEPPVLSSGVRRDTTIRLVRFHGAVASIEEWQILRLGQTQGLPLRHRPRVCRHG